MIEGYYANGDNNRKFYRNAFFYVLDKTHKSNGVEWYSIIVSQQYLQQDRSWSFVKRITGWSELSQRLAELEFAPTRALLPTAILPEEKYPLTSWEYYREINKDDTLLTPDGNVKKFYEEYINTGFIPDELTNYVIPVGELAMVR